MKRSLLPCALTIAGSDSGGGAGIQADLKTFAAVGVHGTSAITCVTAQNPKEVLCIHPLPVSVVRDQIKAVLSGFSPQAIKTGMLFSSEIIECVLHSLQSLSAALIVDPVMISTSGTPLLEPGDDLAESQNKLFLRASLVTPNVPELESILRVRIQTLEDLRSAARAFYARFRIPVLAKGGHLPGPAAIDFYFDGGTQLVIQAPRIKGISIHGTGCTYSAAIAAYMALGLPLLQAISEAKELISAAIATSYRSGAHPILNPFGVKR